MTPDLSDPSDAMEAIGRIFAAEPVPVDPDDPTGPDYGPRTTINVQSLYGFTVETIGSPLRLS